MRKKGILILVALFISSCFGSMARHEEVIRTGILKVGLNKQAFLNVWGEPDKTNTVNGNEYEKGSMAAFKGSGGGSYKKGVETLEVWEYQKIGIQLYFNQSHLAGWKTDRTVQELKAAARPI